MAQLKRAMVKDIKLEPLSQSEIQDLLKQIFNNYSDQLNPKEDIFGFLRATQQVVNDYIQEYDKAWSLFNSSFQLEKTRKAEMAKLSANASVYDKQNVYVNLKSNQGVQSKGERFLRTLEKGYIILEYIRNTLLPDHQIQTEFTIKDRSGSVYRVNKHNVPYKLVLSTYGASGKNFVSLAYSFNVTKANMDALRNALGEELKQIDTTSIYQRIMSVKPEYLQRKAELTGKTYYPSFDSKDAEIFNLLSQMAQRQGETFNVDTVLTVSYYEQLRRDMGGSGGSGGPKTTAFQVGDVGLIQDKMISASTNAVNFARQTLIRKSFLELQKALATLTEGAVDTLEIKKGLLSLFTANGDIINDDITREVNAATDEIIESLFKNTS